jgi:hypothetical protein
MLHLLNDLDFIVTEVTLDAALHKRIFFFFTYFVFWSYPNVSLILLTLQIVCLCSHTKHKQCIIVF